MVRMISNKIGVTYGRQRRFCGMPGLGNRPTSFAASLPRLRAERKEYVLDTLYSVERTIGKLRMMREALGAGRKFQISLRFRALKSILEFWRQLRPVSP